MSIMPSFSIQDRDLWYYRAFVDRVVDGDTVDLIVDLGMKIQINMRARLLDIDAPEIFSHKKGTPERKEGETSAKALEEKILGHEVLIRTKKDRKGKYGRWLVTILLPISLDKRDQGMDLNRWDKGYQDINRWMISEGHATASSY